MCDADTAAEALVQLLTESRSIRLDWDKRLTGGQGPVQASYLDLVTASSRIINVSPFVIPGQLQTVNRLAAGQLDRLLSVIELPNVELGVVPLDVRLDGMVPTDFVIYDDQVVIETYAEEHHYRGGAKLETYREAAKAALDLAVTGSGERGVSVDELAAETISARFGPIRPARHHRVGDRHSGTSRPNHHRYPRRTRLPYR